MHVLDLFSGIGGLSLGLEWAGFETVAFCESDRQCRKVLKKHWPHVPIFLDVQSLTYEKLTADGITEIDVITGGFPCVDISLAGKGAGIGAPRSGLWKEFARLIGEIRPRYAIIENVAALLGRGLSTILGDLASIGYDAEWHCIPASAVGAPHQRDRIWIIAYPDSTGCKCGAAIKTGYNASRDISRGMCRNGRPKDVAHTNNAGSQEKGAKQQAERFKQLGKLVSNPNKQHGNSRGYGASEICREQSREAVISKSKFYDTQSKGLQIGGPASGSECPDWWQTEPPVCGVAYGLSGRVDRLKQLGNAVVPQIPYLIGLAILEFERRKTCLAKTL